MNDHPRFSLPSTLEPPRLSPETENNPEQREAFRLELFEWSVAVTEVEQLIEEVQKE